MTNQAHTKAQTAIRAIEKVLSDENKLKTEAKYIHIDLEYVFQAGHQVSDGVHTIGNDLRDLKKAWDSLSDDLSSEELDAKLKELQDRINAAKRDVKTFRSASGHLDTETNESIGDASVEQKAIKAEITGDTKKFKTLTKRIAEKRVLLERTHVPEPSGIEKGFSDFADSIGLGGDSDPAGLGDLIDPRAKNAVNQINRLNSDIRTLVHNRELVRMELKEAKELAPKIDETLDALGTLDTGTDALENVAKTLSTDVDAALHDLKRERSLHNARAVQHFKDKLKDDIADLLSWNDVFTPDKQPNQRRRPK